MGEQDITFPMDVTDPSRPWTFKPEGYLVVILTGISEARRALSALVEGGFGDRDIKVYSGEQTLENDAVNMRRRAVASRLLGPVTDQTSGVETSISDTHARVAAPCGCVCLTRTLSPRR